MKVAELLGGAQEAISVRRVFGEPFERNGVTVIPAAKVSGGGGGGSDERENGGGGFGLSSRPIGALINKGDKVSWQPAFDLNRVIVGCQVVAVVGILASLLAKRRR
jgi:uncharacterized spore protein YtfJ